MSESTSFEDLTEEEQEQAIKTALGNVYLMVEYDRPYVLTFEPVYISYENENGIVGYMPNDRYVNKLDLAGLQFRVHLWDWGMGGAMTRYSHRSWFDLDESEGMTKTLRLIRNRLEKAYQKFIPDGGDPDLPTFVLALSKAINVVGGVVEGETYHDFGEFLTAMIVLEGKIMAELAAEKEKEAEV
jgi:hypothetical protein